MATVNIGGDQNDKNFRYKRPKIKNKIEGRGNGIKTVITNMSDIAKSLHVDPEYPTKYFGLELGAQSKFDKKREEAIINGSHDVPKLEILLDKFIEVFILCPNCHLPEIAMEVKRSIKIRCAACGHSSELNSVHKVVTFILKNPPESSGKKPASKKEAKKEAKKNKKAGADANGNESGSSHEDNSDKGSDDESEDDATAAANAKAAAKAAAAKLKQKQEEDEVQWATDTSNEAANARREREIEEMKTGKKSIDEIVAQAQDGIQKETPVEALRALINRDKNDIAAVTAELRRLQLARGVDDAQKMTMVLQSIVDSGVPKTAVAQIEKNIKLLKALAKDPSSMFLMIEALEELVGITYPKLTAAVPRILQTLYEGDVLSEEVLLNWHESPAQASKLANKDLASDIRKKANVFVEWLKNAEEEEEEEED